MAIPNAQQHYSLRWNNYLRHITFAFDFLRNNNDLVDVTLYCDGKNIKAHKVLLSACSGYFKEIFRDNPHPHPIIIFKFIKFEDLNAIVEFMYQGRVNIQQDSLQSFLQTAELLAVHGLTSGEKNNTNPPKVEETHINLNKNRPSTTDSITQTTNIDFLKSSISTKKRKIEFTDDEEEENVFNDSVVFSKNENTEIQFISPTKGSIPEYINISDISEQQTQITNAEKQITLNENLITSEANFKSEYNLIDSSETPHSKYQNQENSEIEQDPIENTEHLYSELNQNETELEKQSTQIIEPIHLICKICNRQLQSVSAYRRHNASRHGQKLEKYNCPSCEKSFKTKWSLSTHNSRFHRNKEKQVIKMSFSI